MLALWTLACQFPLQMTIPISLGLDKMHIQPSGPSPPAEAGAVSAALC